VSVAATFSTVAQVPPVNTSPAFHAPAIFTCAYFEPGTPFNDQEAGNLDRDLVRLPDSPSSEVYFVNRAVRPFDNRDPHVTATADEAPVARVATTVRE
jgi:hypothetical protein